MLYNFTVSHIPKMIYSFLTFTLFVPFQIAVKRREAKSKGEKEKYTRLNAEFQRITRRDKKAFLRDQHTCTPMFIAALFIIARTWKQPRGRSADEWIRKL